MQFFTNAAFSGCSQNRASLTLYAVAAYESQASSVLRADNQKKSLTADDLAFGKFADCRIASA
jgi:hypothetical protein